MVSLWLQWLHLYSGTPATKPGYIYLLNVIFVSITIIDFIDVQYCFLYKDIHNMVLNLGSVSMFILLLLRQSGHRLRMLVYVLLGYILAGLMDYKWLVCMCIKMMVSSNFWNLKLPLISQMRLQG